MSFLLLGEKNVQGKKEEIIKEVRELVSQGYQEITLLGQNVNAYGKDFKDEDYKFGDLLYDLDKTGINRIRFTTSHPRDIDGKTITAFKDCKVWCHIYTYLFKVVLMKF